MFKVYSYRISADQKNSDAVFAAELLRDELNRRTGLGFVVAESGDITVSVDKAAATAPEGFTLSASGGKIRINGFDRLGAVHGAGRLLRECRWGKGYLEMEETDISSYPQKPLRGDHLGYFRNNNAYNLWDMETYGQYVKELALFGASAIEFSFEDENKKDNDPDRKCDPFKMMLHITGLTRTLGMQVWVKVSTSWLNETGIPIPRKGYVDETSPAAAEMNDFLRTDEDRRINTFSKIRHIDHIFIPGGDPGRLNARDLFAFSERIAAILHRYHPNAGVWISPQIVSSGEKFTREFYDEVARRPAWLTGIVHGPWCRETMAQCREHIPADLPIRSFPDICHMLCSQYPVHQMDPVWAVTAGRECYNPRPRWHKRMHDLTAPFNIGNIPYTEGIADDVAKYLWLDFDWSESIPPAKTLRDFASMFISPDHADELASLIAGFEDIFEGPAVTNGTVSQVYNGLKALERTLESEEYMPGFGADSYRFKMPRLMSAFYAYIQQKAISDAGAMQKAWSELGAGGSFEEIAGRIREDLEIVGKSPNAALLEEIWRLADECFDRIKWKVSTSRHLSPNYARGGFLDTLASPLCNSEWLKANLDKLSARGDEKQRLEGLAALRDRRNAGPGGKYLSLGEPWSNRYLRVEKSWWDEPEAITIPRIEQYVDIWSPHLKEQKPDATFDKILLERVSSALGYYGANVVLDIDGLVPGAPYELRIVFPLRFSWLGQKDISAYVSVKGKRLEYIGNVPGDEWVYIYDVPAGLVDEEGSLTLVIDKDKGPRGSGATELWLIKKE